MPKCKNCQSIVEELIDGKCKYCLNSFICQSCGKFTLNSDESKTHLLNCNSCANKIDSVEGLGQEVKFNTYLFDRGIVVTEREDNSLFSVKKQGNKPNITTFSFKK